MIEFTSDFGISLVQSKQVLASVFDRNLFGKTLEIEQTGKKLEIDNRFLPLNDLLSNQENIQKQTDTIKIIINENLKFKYSNLRCFVDFYHSLSVESDGSATLKIDFEDISVFRDFIFEKTVNTKKVEFMKTKSLNCQIVDNKCDLLHFMLVY